MRVALFSTCIGDAMFPDVVKATAVILSRLGYDATNVKRSPRSATTLMLSLTPPLITWSPPLAPAPERSANNTSS